MADKSRALIVEDDEPIRTMLMKIVERLDVDVDSAANGAEAIARLDASSYDVILLDLMMPVVDGFEVLRHLKERDPDSLARTIVASAVPVYEIMRQVSEPVYRVHTKPFDVARLLDDINACAHHSDTVH